MSYFVRLFFFPSLSCSQTDCTESAAILVDLKCLFLHTSLIPLLDYWWMCLCHSFLGLLFSCHCLWCDTQCTAVHSLAYRDKSWTSNALCQEIIMSVRPLILLNCTLALLLLLSRSSVTLCNSLWISCLFRVNVISRPLSLTHTEQVSMVRGEITFFHLKRGTCVQDSAHSYSREKKRGTEMRDRVAGYRNTHNALCSLSLSLSLSLFLSLADQVALAYNMTLYAVAWYTLFSSPFLSALFFSYFFFLLSSPLYVAFPFFFFFSCESWKVHMSSVTITLLSSA